MRASELQAIYYHGSRKIFQPGFVLLPQLDGYIFTLSDEEYKTETLLEKYRPKTSLSRMNSVFMVDDPKMIDYAGGYTDHVYIVEPMGKIEKNDLGWYGKLISYVPYTDDIDAEILQWVENYWKGIPYTNHNTWEFRAGAAKIIKEL